MIEARATIIRLEGNEALVESAQGGGCGNCESASGCGTGKVSQLFMKSRRFRVLNEGNAQVGTLVQVALREGVLLRSALLIYMLPLLLLLGGALAGLHWSKALVDNDLNSAVGGLMGLLLGFILVRVISLRRPLLSVARPVILTSLNTQQAD